MHVGLRGTPRDRDDVVNPPPRLTQRAPRSDHRSVATHVLPGRGSLRAGTVVHRLAWVPVSLVLTLYLLVTSRWGSYLTVPGAPIYAGDILVVLATVQATVGLRVRLATLSALVRAPLALHLVVSLLVYAVLRLGAGLDFSLVALRDFAPYGYAVVALLAFLLPVREGRWRPIIYAALVAHLLWVAALPLFPGFPWQLPVLGSDATLFVARPDFDTTVLGLGAAFAIRDLLRHLGPRRRAETAALVIFAVGSGFGMVNMGTRAGLLAGLLAIVVIVVSCLVPKSSRGEGQGRSDRPRLRPVRVAALLVGCAIAAAVLAYTPTGSRLIDGISDASSGAYGTVTVRKTVWDQVADYVLRDAGRTAVGVGFGRNFIAESGSQLALEGTVYKNVRSPHNYVLGTLARLGVAGALMVSMVIGLGWWMGVSQLRGEAGPVGVLAALLALALPVIALLGVVLESPFGAIPYFWALGQLAVLDSSPPYSARRKTTPE